MESWKDTYAAGFHDVLVIFVFNYICTYSLNSDGFLLNFVWIVNSKLLLLYLFIFPNIYGRSRKLLNVENDWDDEVDCPDVMGTCCLISEEEVAPGIK